MRAANALRAAVYVRVSTEEQVDNTSLDDQERICRRFAEAKGWQVTAVFREEGYTGTADSRPRWDEFMRGAKSGEFGVLVVLNWKRFARSARVGLNLCYELGELGVRVAVAEMDLDTTTPLGKVLQGLLLHFAEMDRDMVIEQMARGQYAKARRGLWPSSSSNLPYGYRLGPGGKVLFNEDEVAWLRRVVAWFVDEPGTTTGSACARMTALGLRQRNGNLWTPQNLIRVLTNPKLKGELWWGKPRDQSQYRNAKQTKRYEQGKYFGEPVFIQVEPIIEPDRWAALQPVLARKAYGLQGPRGVFPLRQRMESPCGGVYGGISQAGRARVYRCNLNLWNAQGRPRCGCVKLPAADVEARVWAEVCGLLTDPHRLAQMVTDYAKQVAEPTPEAAAELGDVQERIASLEHRLAHELTDYIRQGVHPSAVVQAQKQIEADLLALRAREAQLATATAETPSSNLTQGLDRLLSLASTVAGRLASMTLEDQIELIELLQIHVVVLDGTKHPDLHVMGVVPWGQATPTTEVVGASCHRGGLPFALAT